MKRCRRTGNIPVPCTAGLSRPSVGDMAMQADKSNPDPAAWLTLGLAINQMLPLHTPGLQGPALSISLTAVQFLNIQS